MSDILDGELQPSIRRAAAKTNSADRVAILHAETRDEAARADRKAIILLCASGLFCGIVSAGLLVAGWTPRRHGDVIESLFWIALALTFAGEVSLFRAVIPQVRHPQNKEALHYYGHVVQFESKKAFLDALDNADSTFDRTVSEIWILSAKAQRKFQLVRRGMLLWGCGIVAASSVLLLAMIGL